LPEAKVPLRALGRVGYKGRCIFYRSAFGILRLFAKGVAREKENSRMFAKRHVINKSCKFMKKGSQKGATWRPEGAKSEPTGDQNASKININQHKST